MGEVISQTFHEAMVSESFVLPGSPPSSHEPRTGQDLEYTATFEVFPTLEINEVAGLTVAWKSQADVTDADVDEMIEFCESSSAAWKRLPALQKMATRWSSTSTAPVDGEPSRVAAVRTTHWNLGSGKMIPGFEDGIVGMSGGGGKVDQRDFPRGLPA